VTWRRHPGPGVPVCNDCERVTSRYRHGPRELCIHCVTNRRRAAKGSPHESLSR
jgi:hypothetical protein